MANWNIYLIFVLLVALLQILVVTASTAEIYCYCNTEACGGASIGYKCRSQSGRCFSKMRYDPQPDDVDNSIHGCADSLPSDERASCEPGDIITHRTNVANSQNDLPILMCCTANMCNYIDQVDPPQVATDNSTQKDSRPEQFGNKAFPQQPTLGAGEYHSYQDIWFRAAVVAVPLVGAVILVVLILMALRMLRHDSRRPMKRDASMAKAQLYVADHFYMQSASPLVPAPSVITQASPCNGAILTGKLSPTVSHGIVYNSDVEDNNSCMQTGYMDHDVDNYEQRISGSYIMRAAPVHICCSQNCNYHLADSKSLILYTTENETDPSRQICCCQKCTGCLYKERSECTQCAKKVLKSETIDGGGKEGNNQLDIQHQNNLYKEKSDSSEINQTNNQICNDSIDITVPNSFISSSDEKNDANDDNVVSESRDNYDKDASHDQRASHDQYASCDHGQPESCADSLKNTPSCYEPFLSNSADS